MEAAIERAGSLNKAIEELDDGPLRRLRRLAPVPIGLMARVIATHHLGDPVTPSDSWRPWRRRADLREGVRRLAPELAKAPLLVDPDAGVTEGAPSGELMRKPPGSSLKGEDFIATE